MKMYTFPDRPAVCSGVGQQQQVFALREDQGKATVPVAARRQLGQIQDLFSLHDGLTTALQQHQLVGGRRCIVTHQQSALCCQEQEALLPLLENESTCRGSGLDQIRLG